jgi:hypothetical protein
MSSKAIKTTVGFIPFLLSMGALIAGSIVIFAVISLVISFLL